MLKGEPFDEEILDEAIVLSTLENKLQELSAQQ